MSMADELRERLKLKYMGDCKCGHCALVPDEMVARAADTLQLMLIALKGVVAVADRKTDEFDAARAAIAVVEGVAYGEAKK